MFQFYEAGGGSVFQVAAQLNGVTYSPASPLPPVQTSAPSGSSSSTSGTPSFVAHRLHASVSIVALASSLLLGGWVIFL